MYETLTYQIALTLIEGVGNLSAKKLVACCGGVEALFRERKSALEKIKLPGLRKGFYLRIGEDIFRRAEKERDFIFRNGIRPLFYLDADYPERLKFCDDGPVLLYCKGKMNLNVPATLSVVGTRNATGYGKTACKQIIGQLVQHNPLIVSGLAYGIDISAHREAIRNNLQTVAVVGHGLDRIYPAIHGKIAEQMMENGGVITEFLSGEKPERENFPLRNRIIAGMADATLVIESGIKGGSMITAGIADSYNREVFALPGRAGDTCSSGCNFLIKTNRAVLVENAGDIERELGWNLPVKASTQKKMFIELRDKEKKLYEIIRERGKLPIDEIALKAGMGMGAVAALLLEMEFKGAIRALPGKIFEII